MQAEWFGFTSQLQCTLSPQKRKPSLESEGLPFFELQPKSWATNDSPRKKPKLAVEVLIPSRSKPLFPFSATGPSHRPSELQASEHGTSDQTSHLTPLSPLSPSPMCDDSAELSRSVEDRPTSELARSLATEVDVRAQSRELSYLGDSPRPSALATVQVS